jgi:hypothetical protein
MGKIDLEDIPEMPSFDGPVFAGAEWFYDPSPESVAKEDLRRFWEAHLQKMRYIPVPEPSPTKEEIWAHYDSLFPLAPTYLDPLVAVREFKKSYLAALPDESQRTDMIFVRVAPELKCAADFDTYEVICNVHCRVSWQLKNSP